MLQTIASELKEHAPFTVFGAILGVVILGIIVAVDLSEDVSEQLFEVFHPAHVVLSAIATTAMYKLHSKGKLWITIIIGYTGAIGIATISDSLIPYAGELLMDLDDPEAHIGFIEDWYIVNPAAFVGIAIGWFWTKTKIPHGGHVLLSTAASLFHITMAIEGSFDWILVLPIFVFLVLAVLLPCCMSDVIYPLIFAGKNGDIHSHHCHGDSHKH